MTDNYNNYRTAVQTPILDTVLTATPLSHDEKAELKLRITMLLSSELA